MSRERVAAATGGWLQGGCHCGAVRFRVRPGHETTVVTCNCSMCRKRGDLQLIVDLRNFELVSGESELALYQFNTGLAQHRFCRVCGIHPFNVPRSDPDCVAVNVRCLDRPHDQPQNQGWRIESFDGEHWEDSMEAYRASQATRAGSS